MKLGNAGKSLSERHADGNLREHKKSARRLLRALAGDHCHATPSTLNSASSLDVFSSRKGVSLRTGSATLIDAEELVSQGLCVWSRGKASGRRRLEITPAGRSHITRLDAGQGIEPFQAQHMEISPRAADDSSSGRKVFIDNNESPLAWLATRRSASGKALLDPALFEAGERLRRDLTIAQMVPRVTASWGPSLGGGQGHSAPLTYSEVIISARQRADLALRAVGPEFSGLLMDACGFLKGLELIESERRWPRRSAKLVLGFALGALARHYGIETEAISPASSRKVRHWGSGDYRPMISPPTP